MSTNLIKKHTQPKLDALHSVQEYDVLLGRGKLYEKHTGNQNFRSAYVEWYIDGQVNENC